MFNWFNILFITFTIENLYYITTSLNEKTNNTKKAIFLNL